MIVNVLHILVPCVVLIKPQFLSVSGPRYLQQRQMTNENIDDMPSRRRHNNQNEMAKNGESTTTIGIVSNKMGTLIEIVVNEEQYNPFYKVMASD